MQSAAPKTEPANAEPAGGAVSDGENNGAQPRLASVPRTEPSTPTPPTPTTRHSLMRRIFTEPTRHVSSSFLCGNGWPQFWLYALMSAVSEVFCALSIVDIATAYFNGGTDPCTKGASSAACKQAVQNVVKANVKFVLLRSVLAFSCAPIVANLCDAVGRKPMIVAQSLLVLLNTIALFAVYRFGVSVYWFFLSVSALGFLPNSVIWNIWVADRVAAAERTRFFAVLAIATDIEMFAAPLVALIASRGACVAISCTLGFVSHLLAVFGIPESIDPEHHHRLRSAGLSARLRNMGVVFTDDRVKSVTVLLLIGSSVLYGINSIYFPYMKARFSVGIKEVSPLLSVNSIANLIMQLFLVKPLSTLLGMRNIILMSFAMGIINMIVIMCSSSLSFVYIAAPLGALSVICLPAVNALYINLARPEQRAQVQGAYSSLTQLCKGIGPAIFGGTFAFFLQKHNFLSEPVVEAPWILGLFCDTCCVFLMLRLPMQAFPENEENT